MFDDDIELFHISKSVFVVDNASIVVMNVLVVAVAVVVAVNFAFAYVVVLVTVNLDYRRQINGEHLVVLVANIDVLGHFQFVEVVDFLFRQRFGLVLILVFYQRNHVDRAPVTNNNRAKFKIIESENVNAC